MILGRTKYMIIMMDAWVRDFFTSAMVKANLKAAPLLLIEILGHKPGL